MLQSTYVRTYVKSNYLKCIVSQCLWPPCVFFFLFTFILCIRKMQTSKFTHVILKYVKNWLSSKLAKRKYTLKLRHRGWIEIWKVSSRLFPLLPWYEGLYWLSFKSDHQFWKKLRGNDLKSLPVYREHLRDIY